MHLTGEAAIRRRSREIPATYVIFDCCGSTAQL
jgi:hypothetical protein